MYLSWPLFILIVLALVGGVVGGGMFTIVLIPLAMIAALVALAVWAFGRAAGAAGAGSTSEPVGRRGNVLPRSGRDSRGRAPSSPERLADLRREQQ